MNPVAKMLLVLVMLIPILFMTTTCQCAEDNAKLLLQVQSNSDIVAPLPSALAVATCESGVCPAKLEYSVQGSTSACSQSACTQANGKEGGLKHKPMRRAIKGVGKAGGKVGVTVLRVGVVPAKAAVKLVRVRQRK